MDILIDLGHAVVGEAIDGGDAVKKYEALRPDIVLMDITMPDVNGIEGLRRIRQINPRAKVIMCTAMSQEFYVKEAIKEGAVDYICKPFNAELINDVLQKAIAKK